MSKQTKKTEQPLEFFDTIKDHRAYQWLMERKQLIPYISMAVLLLLIIAFKFSGKRTAQTESNYLIADSYYNQLTRSLEFDNAQSELVKLADLVKAYPELESKYGGFITQLYLATDDSKEAKPFAEKTLSRVSKDRLIHTMDFSKTTLLIADEALQKALNQALALKQFLQQNPELQTYAHLFAYNLLRIALLEKKAGSSNGEFEAWKEWKRYAENSENMQLSEAFVELNNQFKVGDFSLAQYIEAREKQLKSSS